MLDLPDVMLKAVPREKAGARTGARFAFQVHASLARLLDLHEAGVEYRALFDHFDDLAILSVAGNPTSVEFVQIKGRETDAWKAGDLCKPAGNKPRTTIAKMYHHTEEFADTLTAAVFLTNAPFKFTLSNGKATTPDDIDIQYATLGTADTETFAKALEMDYPSPRAPNEGSFLRFQRTKVPLRGFETYVKGRLVEFFGEQRGVPVNAVYKTLVTDIAAKSNDTTECLTVTSLYACKSLSRMDMESVLAAALKHQSILDDWQSVDAELCADGRPLPARLRLRTAITNYLRNRSKRAPDWAALCSALRDAVMAAGDSLFQVARLVDAAALIAGHVDIPREQYDEQVWEAALFVEAFDALNGQ